MEITQEHRDNVKKKIVEALLKALRSREIETKELPMIGYFVLEEIEDIKTKKDMMSFLQELSARWRIFSIVLVLESGEYKLQEERKTVDDALSLLRQGKTEAALQMVKGATA